MAETPQYSPWGFYRNGIDDILSGDEANEIIEEIIGIMRKHKVTVDTSRQLLEDTISSIRKTTIIT